MRVCATGAGSGARANAPLGLREVGLHAFHKVVRPRAGRLREARTKTGAARKGGDDAKQNNLSSALRERAGRAGCDEPRRAENHDRCGRPSGENTAARATPRVAFDITGRHGRARETTGGAARRQARSRLHGGPRGAADRADAEVARGLVRERRAHADRDREDDAAHFSGTGCRGGDETAGTPQRCRRSHARYESTQ